MNEFVPAFEWQRVMVAPWGEDYTTSFWVVLMGFLVGTACGLVGNYLLLRRMALVGDAISHSILPGLVLAFVLFKENSLWVAMAGALSASLVTVILIEWIHRQSKVKPDAAICIVFTTLFALGVAMISVLETGGNIHIDAECVLYGEIAFVGLEPPFVWNGIEIGPPSVLRMAAICLAVVFGIVIFYKELLITSFDSGLARSLGINSAGWHYGLMAVLSIVIVGVFEAVGAILAVALVVVPPMFAAQLSARLPVRFVLTGLHAALSAVLGYHLSVWLECSAAGAMVTAGAFLFILAWVGTAWMRLLHRKNVPAVVENDALLPVP